LIERDIKILDNNINTNKIIRITESTQDLDMRELYKY